MTDQNSVTASEGRTPIGWASPKEAAEYTGFKVPTLANWRTNRTHNREPKGPVFYKIHGHQIRYRYADLDAWITSNP